LPFPLFPSIEGLIPFGTTENSNCLNWLAKGDPNQWKVIVWDPDALEFVDIGNPSLIKYILAILDAKHGVLPNDPPLDSCNSPNFIAIDYDNII